MHEFSPLTTVSQARTVRTKVATTIKEPLALIGVAVGTTPIPLSSTAPDIF